VCANPRPGGGGRVGRSDLGLHGCEGATLAPTLPTPPGPGTLARLALNKGRRSVPGRLHPEASPAFLPLFGRSDPEPSGQQHQSVSQSVSPSVRQPVSLCNARGHSHLSRPSPRRVQRSAAQRSAVSVPEDSDSDSPRLRRDHVYRAFQAIAACAATDAHGTLAHGH